ncbi:MAG TPA: NAD(+) synthase [Vicinamibacterales bacterium]|jgi:NAD+ synthase|nr:NAD(+) synthase [Vicinamibacterales bacterium]
MSAQTEAIVDWLREQLKASGSRGFVVGLSGGIDSAVVVRLCQMAAPGSVVGVVMPCHSDPRDEVDAMTMATHFKIASIHVDLAPTFDALTSALQHALSALPAGLAQAASGDATDIKARMPLANVKPRLRMATLYYIANTLNYMVVGTGNRSELTIGYFTKYGDGGVDLLPIGNLLKSDVRAAARELGVPSAIIEKAPSAGLWLGQTDEDEMGFTYADLENYLLSGPDAVSPALGLRIERLMRASEHKRALPPAPREG